MGRKRAIFWSIVGLTAYWPLLRRNCVSVLSVADSVPAECRQWLYLLFILCIAAGGVVVGAAVLHSKAPSRIAGAVTGGFLAAGVAGSVVSGVLWRAVGSSVVPSSVVAAACNAIFLAAASVALALAVRRLVAGHRVLLCAGSFALSFVASLPFALAPGLNAPCVLALQVIAGCSCVVLGRLGAGEGPADVSVAPMRLADVLGGGRLGGMAVVLALFLLVGGFIRGAVGSGVLSGIGIDQFALEKALLSTAIALVVLAIVFFSEENGRFAYACWSVLSVAFFGGLFYLAVSSPDQISVAGIVIIPCRTFLGFLLWVVLMELGRGSAVASAALVGCVFLPTEALSWALSDYGVLVAVRWLAIDLQSSLGAFALIMALFLIASVFLLLRTADSDPLRVTARAQEGSPGAAAGDGEEGSLPAQAAQVDSPPSTSLGGSDAQGRLRAVQQLQSRFGLTDREAEVALLASQGHSYKHIAEALFISQSTTQTHVRNVYRKLGVNRRQGLIDLVNAIIED